MNWYTQELLAREHQNNLLEEGQKSHLAQAQSHARFLHSRAKIAQFLRGIADRLEPLCSTPEPSLEHKIS